MLSAIATNTATCRQISTIQRIMSTRSRLRHTNTNIHKYFMSRGMQTCEYAKRPRRQWAPFTHGGSLPPYMQAAWWWGVAWACMYMEVDGKRSTNDGVYGWMCLTCYVMDICVVLVHYTYVRKATGKKKFKCSGGWCCSCNCRSLVECCRCYWDWLLVDLYVTTTSSTLYVCMVPYVDVEVGFGFGFSSTGLWHIPCCCGVIIIWISFTFQFTIFFAEDRFVWTRRVCRSRVLRFRVSFVCMDVIVHGLLLL